MKNGFATSSYAARLIEHAARFRDKTGRGKVSTEPVALLLAHPGTPILSKMNVATAGDSICTTCHPNLNPRALPPIRSIIWTSQPDLNALRPGSFHFWKILPAAVAHSGRLLPAVAQASRGELPGNPFQAPDGSKILIVWSRRI